MSVLVYAESWEGKFRKSTYEAISYASETAKKFGQDVVAIAFGGENDEELQKLGKYGAKKVLAANGIQKGDSASASKVFIDNINDASIIIFGSSYTSKMIAPRIAANLKAGIVSNVVSIPSNNKPIQLTRKSFSSKAMEHAQVNTEKAIINLAPNAFGIIESNENCVIERINSNNASKVTIENQEIASGKISLSEAEIVVSAGRGLKGPENWGMIEELASLLGAATACSKPVSDIGWRSHSEHVGQTGKAVAPNLYIAIGISGAIQHLAGVNSSKVMVAINTDAEAPFFKAADYGIVGDAFEVVPKLIEEIKKIQ